MKSEKKYQSTNYQPFTAALIADFQLKCWELPSSMQYIAQSAPQKSQSEFNNITQNDRISWKPMGKTAVRLFAQTLTGFNKDIEVLREGQQKIDTKILKAGLRAWQQTDHWPYIR